MMPALVLTNLYTEETLHALSGIAGVIAVVGIVLCLAAALGLLAMDPEPRRRHRKAQCSWED